MTDAVHERQINQALCELADLIGIENQPASQPNLLGFQHFGTLYIRYMQLFHKFLEAYDHMTHVQRRAHLRKVIETLLVRIGEIKNYMLFYNPRPGSRIVAMDELLIELRVPPSVLEWRLPSFLKSPKSTYTSNAILHWQSVFNVSVAPEVLVPKRPPPKVPFTIEQAVRLIQRNERGRLGILKLMSWAVARRHKHPESSQPDQAGSKIVASWRGLVSRRSLNLIRQQEFKALGLAPSADEICVVSHADLADEQLRADIQFKEASAIELGRLRDAILPGLTTKLTEERMQWIMDVRSATGAFPENLEGFYKRQGVKPGEELPEAATDGKKGDKKKKKGDKKAAKKAGKAEAPPATFEVGTTEAVQSLASLLNEYNDTFKMSQSEGFSSYTLPPLLNPSPYFDLALLRRTLIPQIELEAQTTAEAAVKEQLANLKKTFDPLKKDKKKKAKKKATAKKPKPWFSAHGTLTSAEDAFADLVADGVAKNIQPAKLGDFIGDMCPIESVLRGAVMTSAEVSTYAPTSATNSVPSTATASATTYLPPPSYQAIRSLIFEHCVFPLTSLAVRRSSPVAVKSLLLYGPSGNGKSLLAKAIATEAGATFFDVSPNVLRGKYPDNGPGLFIWKLWLAARLHEPAVIYCEDVELLFPKKKKGESDNEEKPSRLKRDLLGLMKQIKTGQSSTAEDRVLFIGATSRPFSDECDAFELADSFQEKLWIASPDYAARCVIWRDAIEAKGVPKMITRSAEFNVSLLANNSEGFSTDGIRLAVNEILTERRVKLVASGARELEAEEFLTALAKQPYSWPENWAAFREFDHDATGERLRQMELEKGSNKKGREEGKKGKKT